MRVLGAIIINGFLTAIFWTVAIYLHLLLTETPMDGFFTGKFALFVTIIWGAVIGCVIGFLISLLNTSIFRSAIIGGLICLAVGLALVFMDFMSRIPSGLELIGKMIFILAPSVLAAISSSITAKLFNSASK